MMEGWKSCCLVMIYDKVVVSFDVFFGFVMFIPHLGEDKPGGCPRKLVNG